ncbi:MAG: hypothetical protein B7Z55_16470 [Planctomycetales bacterium 12-60-4]|nr:MAG: hypothetical protein B7Z55_16470 [Planctomycetales bacterium 12-60-4]
MVRASGFSVGLFIAMWGGTFLWVDKLVLFDPPKDKAGIRGMLTKEQVALETRPVIDPADWSAFTLMSIGSVTMLYSVALPKKPAG